MAHLQDVPMEDHLSRGLEASIHAKGNSLSSRKNSPHDGVDPGSDDPISEVSENRRSEPIGDTTVIAKENLGKSRDVTPVSNAVAPKLSYAAAVSSQTGSSTIKRTPPSFNLVQRLNQNFAIRVESANMSLTEKQVFEALMVVTGGTRPTTFCKLPNGDFGLRMPNLETFNKLKDALLNIGSNQVQCAAMSAPRKDQIVEFKLMRVPFFALYQDIVSALVPYGRVTRITQEIRKDLMVGTGNLLVTMIRTPGSPQLGRSVTVLGRELAILPKGMCAKCHKMGHLMAMCPERKLKTVDTQEIITDKPSSPSEITPAPEDQSITANPSLEDESMATNPSPEDIPCSPFTPEPSPEVQMLLPSSPDPLQLLISGQDDDAVSDDAMPEAGDTTPDDHHKDTEDLFTFTAVPPRQSGAGSRKVQHTRPAIFDIFPSKTSTQSPLGSVPPQLAGKKRDQPPSPTPKSGYTSLNNNRKKKSALYKSSDDDEH